MRNIKVTKCDVFIVVLVTQSCLTLCNSLDCNLPGSSFHGIFQARILEWVATPFFRGSSRLRNWIRVSCISGRFFTSWATSYWASLVAQSVENLPAMWGTWVQYLVWEDPLEEGMTNPLQYSCLENPHGQRSLVDCSPWSHKELDMIEQLMFP